MHNLYILVMMKEAVLLSVLYQGEQSLSMINKPLKLYFVGRCSNNNATVRYKKMLLNLQAY